MPASTVAISIATYKRPDLLSNLLASVEEFTSHTAFRLIVVDNDPDGSGRETVISTTLPVEYVIESRPGIAAARNAGLQMLRPTDSFVVFVDDDERVSEGWLDALMSTQVASQADVVAGPVISIFGADTPRWIVRGRFIQRARFADGSHVRSPATNNTLVRTEFLRKMGNPLFNETFSMTGGSDTEFFRRVSAAGATMVWSDRAIVFEDVPPSRANFTWIWKRGVREGNVSGRLRLAYRSRPRLFAEGLVRLLYGALRQGAQFILGCGLQAKSVAYMTRGMGWMGASLNVLVVEYSRPKQSGNIGTIV